MVRVRAPSVDADRFGCAGTLASARDQFRNPDWIGNAPVQFAAAVEEATADEVNVLEVKEDRERSLDAAAAASFEADHDAHFPDAGTALAQ